MDLLVAWMLICFAAVYTLGPVTIWVSDCLRRGKPSQYVTNHPGRLSLLASVEQ